MCGERLAGQPAPGARRTSAPSASQLVEHRVRTVGGVDDDADVRVVLRRRPDHRRAADVDELCRLAPCEFGCANG